jgi:hypothetical protein
MAATSGTPAGTSAFASAAGAQPVNSGCTVSSILVPSCGIWTGVSPNTVPSNRQQGLKDYELATGQPADIYHAYHEYGQLFPNAMEISIARQTGSRRLLLMNYRPEGGHTWAQVARGASDAELDREAAYLKSHFTEKFFLAIHHEPEDEVVEQQGSGYTAADYSAMYRHVALRLRAQGVKNAVFVWNIMGAPVYGMKSWFNQLYPGNDVVDWVSGDPYACREAKVCKDFEDMLNRRYSPTSPWPGFYNWVTKNHPGKPIMLSEWGVFHNVGTTQSVAVFDHIRAQVGNYPALKAMVYWNSSDRIGDCRLWAGTPETAAMRKLLALPIFAQRVP